MSKQTEAIKLAIEVFDCNWHDEIVDTDWADKANNALTVMREALEKEALHKLATESLNEGLRLDDWAKIGCVNHDCDQCKAQQEPVQQGILARKWILHGGFADVASFDSEGVPSFYGKESVAKFQKGQLSEPCKGKNCGSLNGWLHSAECRAEHEAQYPTPQPQQEQKDAARYQHIKGMARAMSLDINGNHYWTVALHGIRGPSLDEAIDRAIEAAHGITEGNT